MSLAALNAKKRNKESQRYSFEHTSYYILDKKLPWQMDAIEFLWNFDSVSARNITTELIQKINLGARKSIYSK